MLEAHRIVHTYMQESPLLESGLILYKDFLGPELAKKVWDQGAEGYIKDGRKPETMVMNLTGTPAYEASGAIFPLIFKFFQPSLRKELKWHFAQQTYIQHLLNAPGDGDDQKVFHSDTFFPNLKFWYFPKSVVIDEGPFWFVPESVRLTPQLIEWHKARVEDLKAGRDEFWRGPSHREGSFRINDEELAVLGLKGIPVEVEADTLVVANVFGFHKRGETKRPTHRISIHGNLRLLNPFEHE